MNEKYKSKILLLHFNKQDRTVLYIGYTENLKRRLSQHNNGDLQYSQKSIVFVICVILKYLTIIKVQKQEKGN